jgi:hypothetical protein
MGVSRNRGTPGNPDVPFVVVGIQKVEAQKELPNASLDPAEVDTMVENGPTGHKL